MMDTGSYSAQIVSLENENRQLLLQARDRLHATRRSRLQKRTLAAKRAIYAENHPDVVAAREKLKAVRSASVTPDTSDTSAVQEQIRANNEAIGTLRAQKDAAIAQVNAANGWTIQGTSDHGASFSARRSCKRPAGAIQERRRRPYEGAGQCPYGQRTAWREALVGRAGRLARSAELAEPAVADRGWRAGGRGAGPASRRSLSKS